MCVCGAAKKQPQPQTRQKDKKFVILTTKTCPSRRMSFPIGPLHNQLMDLQEETGIVRLAGSEHDRRCMPKLSLLLLQIKSAIEFSWFDPKQDTFRMF